MSESRHADESVLCWVVCEPGEPAVVNHSLEHAFEYLEGIVAEYPDVVEECSITEMTYTNAELEAMPEL